MNYLKMDYYE